MKPPEERQAEALERLADAGERIAKTLGDIAAHLGFLKQTATQINHKIR
jgi:hypothetical protein